MEPSRSTSPFPARVSWQSIDENNDPSVVNIWTGTFPADTGVKAFRNTTVLLPPPYIAPIISGVHPTSDTLRWFAAKGL